MPIGVPRIIYCWGEELPAQWTDIYNFIFRRRMIFLMQYLDDELCNQICGLLINIHMEDRSKELEKKEMEKSNVFKSSTKIGSNSSTSKTNASNTTNRTNTKNQNSGVISQKSIQDLLISEEDLEIDENYKLEQYTLQKITLDWLNWTANFFDYTNEPYLFYLTEILTKDFLGENANLLYGNSFNYTSLNQKLNESIDFDEEKNSTKTELAELAAPNKTPNFKFRGFTNSVNLSKFMGVYKAMLNTSILSNRLNKNSWTEQVFDYWISWNMFLRNSEFLNMEQSQAQKFMNTNNAEFISRNSPNSLIASYAASGRSTQRMGMAGKEKKEFLSNSNNEQSRKTLFQKFNSNVNSFSLYSPFRFLANFTSSDYNFNTFRNIIQKNSTELNSFKEIDLLEEKKSDLMVNVVLKMDGTKQKLIQQLKYIDQTRSKKKFLSKEILKELVQKQYNFNKQNNKKILESSKKALGQRILKNQYRQDTLDSLYSYEKKNVSISSENKITDSSLSLENRMITNVNEIKSIDRFKIKNAKNYLNLTNSFKSEGKGEKIPTSFTSVKSLKEKERTFSYRKQAERTLQEEELKKVFVIINSFGGSVGNGITVHDALQFIKAGSLTLALGVAASAASLALAGGTIGERYVTEGCHTMIHQPECLTPEHDVLTNEGWLPIQQVTTEHKVAILDPDTKQLMYKNPSKTHAYDYNGPIYYVKNEDINLKVTMNHKMYVCTTSPDSANNQYNLHEASTIQGKKVRYFKSANWSVPDYQFILPAVIQAENISKPEQPAKALPMKEWLLFFGLWIAEGCTFSNKNLSHVVQISQKKPELCTRIRECLDKLGYNYSETILPDNQVIAFRFCDKQMWTYLNQLSTETNNKKLPSWIWELSKEQCSILLEGLILGDGYLNKNDNTRHYFTTCLDLANDVSRLALHCGFAASMALENQISLEAGTLTNKLMETNQQPLYRVNISTRVEPYVNYNANNEKEDFVEDYQGKVYCLTVETGIFYVRREGCCVWTGNSSINGQASDILIDSNEIMKIRLDVAEIYSLSTYRPRHKILRDLDRDFYLTATETVYYGLADEIASNEIMSDIIEMTSKVWDYHESQQQRLLETRESATFGIDTQTQN